jgi:pyrroloquinoline quinone biosynthesis protein D
LNIDSSARPSVGHGFRLQWESAQNSHVLLYPEGMVKLNSSAGEIMSRCDGKRSVAEIVADLERAFEVGDLSDDVAAFMSLALEKQWLQLR